MVMIPLNFLLAAPLLAIAIWLIARRPQPMRCGWLILFLVVFAGQLMLLGIRYGYGASWVVSIQGFTGVCVPILGYLAFRNPELEPRVALHLAPIAFLTGVVFFLPDLIDVTLALITFFYCALLIRLGWSGTDATPWAPLHWGRLISVGLWATVVSLLISGVTDAVIAADFMATGGKNTSKIAASTSYLVKALFPAWLLYLWLRERKAKLAGPVDDDREVLDRIDAALKEGDLFRDPDLSLIKLARKLGLPSRRLSIAINRLAGQNVSQYVNQRRIDAACTALRETDQSVTSIMLDSGFYTKSNFNREFRRITGLSPSQWREQEADKN